MLVFISDIHLTDGTSGETIKSGAFKKFSLYLEDMADTAGANEIEVVFLGDIFDVIRSDYWLNSNIRPWSDAHEKDVNGNGLQDYTKEIVSRICAEPANTKSMQHLKEFKEAMNKKGRDVKFTYIVGNHDWLINRYQETRIKIAEFLSMDNPAQYKNNPFLTEGFWDRYRVFARHGDVYDPFNFDGNRDASSLGDAVVIDLINRFPKAVENDLAAKGISDNDLIKRLKEIDNVRPVIDAPAWILSVCRRAASSDAVKRVKDVWNGLVDDFFKIGFVKKHDTWSPFDPVDKLKTALWFSEYSSLKGIASLPLKTIQRFSSEDADYIEKAYNEDCMRENEAEFVLYGHTHTYTMEPLDILQKGGEILDKIYINTGTWRKVHVRTAYDEKNLEFMGWHVLTFIAFYLDNEREDKRFEIWNGALG